MLSRMKIIIFEFFVLINYFSFIISISGILDMEHRKNLVQANAHNSTINQYFAFSHRFRTFRVFALNFCMFLCDAWFYLLGRSTYWRLKRWPSDFEFVNFIYLNYSIFCCLENNYYDYDHDCLWFLNESNKYCIMFIYIIKIYFCMLCVRFFAWLKYNK